MRHVFVKFENTGGKEETMEDLRIGEKHGLCPKNQQ